MGYTVAPRNSATATASNSTQTATATLTVTSTVAGDLGVVVVTYHVQAFTGTITHTWTPPAGWTLIQDESVNTSAALHWGVAIFYNPKLAAGVTSLAFKIAFTGGTSPFLSSVNAMYGAWQGGGGTPVTTTEGSNKVGTTVSSSTIPSVTMAANATTPDLVVWGGFQSATVANPGTPTGFTSVAVTSTNSPGGRMAAIIGTINTETTASGATSTAGETAYGAVIAGFTTHADRGFFNLARP